MAESSDDSSNLLFQTLADWNYQLKHSGIEPAALAAAASEAVPSSSPKRRAKSAALDLN